MEDPLKTHLTLDGSEGRGFPTTYREEAEAVEEAEEEEEVVVEEEEAKAEEMTKEIKMTKDLDQS